MRFYENTFLNPEWWSFRPGFNTCCIFGERDYKNLLEILDNSSGFIYLKFIHPYYKDQFKLAQLLSLERLYYKQVSVTDSASNHLVRTKEDLDILMRKSYGKYFNNDSIVSLLGFSINQ